MINIWPDDASSPLILNRLTQARTLSRSLTRLTMPSRISRTILGCSRTTRRTPIALAATRSVSTSRTTKGMWIADSAPNPGGVGDPKTCDLTFAGFQRHFGVGDGNGNFVGAGTVALDGFFDHSINIEKHKGYRSEHKNNRRGNGQAA